MSQWDILGVSSRDIWQQVVVGKNFADQILGKRSWRNLYKRSIIFWSWDIQYLCDHKKELTDAEKYGRAWVAHCNNRSIASALKNITEVLQIKHEELIPGIVKVLGHVKVGHGGHHRSHLRLNPKCQIEADQGINLNSLPGQRWTWASRSCWGSPSVSGTLRQWQWRRRKPSWFPQSTAGEILDKI